jgi:hypothetical protein
MRGIVRPMVAAAAVAGLAACAVPHAARIGAPPDPEAARTQLLEAESAVRTVRGLARLEFEGPQGSGSATQVLVVALPDRARVEALTPLGTTALVATIRAEELRVHSLLRREFGVGRATHRTLSRLVKVAVPPESLLRLLAGLPPLPLRAQDPRLTLAADGEAVRVESVDGEYWQRLWVEGTIPAVARGELWRASELVLVFALADRRTVGGRAFPFDLQIEEPSSGSRLRLRYERVEINADVEAGLFELPPPADPGTRMIDLGGG